MTRGLGSLQQRVVAALESGREHDYYDVTALGEYLDGLSSPVQARWRWYTIDLLGLVEPHASEVKRATLLAAVRGLARRGHLETTRTAYPYNDPFCGYLDDGQLIGQVDLAELREVDPRWPARHGRRLWFRGRPPAPARIPPNDQISILAQLQQHRPDALEDFAAALDRRKAWTSPVGHFLAWLLCGHTRIEPGRVARHDLDTQDHRPNQLQRKALGLKMAISAPAMVIGRDGGEDVHRN